MHGFKTCEMRNKTVLGGAEPLHHSPWPGRYCNMSQTVVTYSMKQGREEMLVTQF